MLFVGNKVKMADPRLPYAGTIARFESGFHVARQRDVAVIRQKDGSHIRRITSDLVKTH